MGRKWFKHALLIMMFSVFGMLLYRMGWGYENVGRAVWLMMTRSFLIGGLVGIVFMPRSWCKICPMGHAAGLIRGVRK